MRLQDLADRQIDGQPGSAGISARRMAAAAAVVSAVALCTTAFTVDTEGAWPSLSDWSYWVAFVTIVMARFRALVVGGASRGWSEAPIVLGLVLAVLLHVGFMAALLPLIFSTLLKDVLSRKSVTRVALNSGQYALSLAAVQAVATALGSTASFSTPGRVGASAVGVASGCALTMYLVNRGLVCAVLAHGCDTRFGVQWHFGLRADAGAAVVIYALVAPLWSLMEASPALLPLILVAAVGAQRLSWTAHEGDRLSLTDGLTGLPNRRSFEDSVAEACRQGTPVVLMADLNDFKQVNDRWGHAVGDELLRAAAQRLVEAVRPGDVVARLGGDEFGVLLTDGGTYEDGVRTAQRLRTALDVPFVLGPVTTRTPVSVGVAELARGADGPSGLLHDADHQMYADKRQGRGQTALGGAAHRPTSPAMDRHDLATRAFPSSGPT